MGLVLGLFLLLTFASIPIGAAIGGASVITLLVQGGFNMAVGAQRMYTAIDSVTLLSVPLFIYCGKIMEKGGMSRQIIDFANALVGHVQGALGMTAVLASAIFAAISGASSATVAAIGGIMIPVLIEAGYPAAYAAAICAAGGCIGAIIPPSIPFVVYASITDQSIGEMFAAGVVPGVLMTLALLLHVYFYSKKKGFGGPVNARFSLSRCWKAFKGAVWALLMPVIILGGIYSGFCTPTEAAAIVCVYGMIVSIFVYKGYSFKDIPKLTYEAGVTTANTFIIVATASLFAWVMARMRIPQMLVEGMLGLSSNSVILLLLTNLVLLINGCFMEATASLYIYVPTFKLLAEQLGIDLVHMGMIICGNNNLGLLTPPLGINLFIACTVDKRVNFNKLIKAVMPLFLLLLAIQLLVTFVPDICLFLPKLMRKG